MQYLVTRGEKGKIDVKVDVPKVGFEEVYEQTLLKLGAETNIAGFRLGKIPRDVLIGHVGSNKVLNQTASFLISKHLSEILKKEKLVPIDSPKIAVDALSVGSPFSFTASFTQKPRVKVGDWKKIKVAKIKAKEVTEKDIDQSIKNIHEAWRKQKVSDVSKVSEVSKEEQKEESGKFIYDAHGEKIFFKDEESKSQAESQGIDDNFAKAIGSRDLAHLKELVKKDLETIVADQVEGKFEQEVFEKIAEIGEVDVPEILVEDELNRMLVKLNSVLEQQKKTLEQYLTEQKTTIDELKNKWSEQAQKNVKISLIMDQIGKDEKVQVTKEEVEQALKGVNQTNQSPEQRREFETYIVFSIFQAKTLDLVKRIVAV